MIGLRFARLSDTGISIPAVTNRCYSARSSVLVATTVAMFVTAMIFPSEALAIDNPLAFNLYSRQGALLEASATIFQSGTSVLVDVVGKRRIPERSAVTLNAGGCKAPSDLAFALSRVRDNHSLTELKHPMLDILKRAKSMVIHLTSKETSQVLACGTISG